MSRVKRDDRPCKVRVMDLLQRHYGTYDGSQIAIELSIYDEEELKEALVLLFQEGLIELRFDSKDDRDPRNFMDAIWAWKTLGNSIMDTFLGDRKVSSEHRQLVAKRILGLDQVTSST